MKRPIALVGPTAAGKTALSLRVAVRTGAEIVSMDSRQVYRGMDIGTAKVDAASRALVPHHVIDVVDPDERFSAGRFATLARRALREIADRGAPALLVGGTGFFLRALTHPIFEEPPLEETRREELRAELERLSTPELLARLEALDAEQAVRLSRQGGRQRILRALELPILTGRPLGWWQRNAPAADAPLRPHVFVLDVPRPALYGAIDGRVGRMADAGLLDEVRTLAERGYGPSAPGMNATGYAELLPVVHGDAALEIALTHVRSNTRAYARRQLTWFRHQLPAGARWLDGRRPADALAAEIAEAWNEEVE